MQQSRKSVKNVHLTNNGSGLRLRNGMFVAMKAIVLFSILSVISLRASAAANCQEKIAKLLGLPKMASISINPMPPTEDYQDYFVSYMTEEKMGTMIARCFNDDTKDAYAVPDTNPGANPANEDPYGSQPSDAANLNMAPVVKAALIGPPVPKETPQMTPQMAPQIQWRSKN